LLMAADFLCCLHPLLNVEAFSLCRSRAQSEPWHGDMKKCPRREKIDMLDAS
jgi:hypothetical protein